MDRAQKREFVETMHDTLGKAGVLVVVHNAGLSVADMTDFRVRMKEAGGAVKVAKNRLVKLALDGTDAAVAKDLFQGPTVVAYSEDPVAAPKVVVRYAKDNDKLVIVGGAMGATALDEAGVKALADLPSLDELRARIVGMISTPATRIAQILQAPAGQVARVLGAYAAKDDAA